MATNCPEPGSIQEIGYVPPRFLPVCPPVWPPPSALLVARAGLCLGLAAADLLLGLLGQACGAEAADWTFLSLDLGSVPPVVAYIDTGTIRRGQHLVQAWLLHDLAQPSSRDPVAGDVAPTAHRSSRLLAHFDCAGRGAGVSRWTHFAGAMGRGEVVAAVERREEEITLAAVEPNSLGERTLDFVCRRAAARGRGRT